MGQVEAIGDIGVVWSRAGAPLTLDIQASLQALIESKKMGK